jgi:hypothetical protein
MKRRGAIMMKLRIAPGLGLLLFTATMIGAPVSQAAQPGTLAAIAGNFAARGSGFFTVCFSAGFTAVADCASAPNVLSFDTTQVVTITRDEAGNSCAITTATSAPVTGAIFPTSATASTIVGTTPSYDPTTQSGITSFSSYQGGSCMGAAFVSTGAVLTGTGTATLVVSDSGNRIETVLTSFTAVNSLFSVAGSVQGNVFSQTFIRQ